MLSFLAIHPPHDTIGKRQRPSSAVSIVEMPAAPMDVNSNQLEFMAQLTFMDNTIRRKKLESVWQRSGFVLPIEVSWRKVEVHEGRMLA